MCADDTLPGAAVGPALARLVEQSLVQAVAGRFHLLETLRTYAAERLPEPDRVRLRAWHARDVADRIAELQWQQRPESEPECVAALASMTADLHQAWDHAVRHDRDLAVELAALIYDFAYQRQRLDLLDWGLQVAAWELEHPMLSQALATAAAAAWAARRAAPRRTDRAARHRRRPRHDRPVSARTVGQAATWRCSPGTSRRRSGRGSPKPGGATAPSAASWPRLMCEVSVCQALTYAGDAAEARRRPGGPAATRPPQP